MLRSVRVLVVPVLVTVGLVSLEAKQQTAAADIASLRAGVAEGDPAAQFELAQRLAGGNGVERDEEEAVRLLQLSAEQGHNEAQYMLGMLYDSFVGFGSGIPPQDHAEAVRWLRLAATQGHLRAQWDLAIILEVGRPGVSPDPDESASWYQRVLAQSRTAAGQGDAEAQMLLGEMYSYGRGVPMDPTEAARWFRLAADQGQASAQFTLATLYATGRGVPLDEEEAIRLLRLAAAQERVDASMRLGQIYAKRGDVDEAMRWYQPVAAIDDPGIRMLLGMSYLELAIDQREQSEALRWYRLAADVGEPNAALMLAVSYDCQRPIGCLPVEQSVEEAVRWYRVAADAGHAGGAFELGQRYLDGRGVARDVDEAMRWYRLAMRAESAQVPLALATRYENGNGVPQDLVRAYMWLLVAQPLERRPGTTADRLSNLESRLTTAQIAQARANADTCIASQYGRCVW